MDDEMNDRGETAGEAEARRRAEDQAEAAEHERQIEKIASEALPYRVTGREWRTAQLVADHCVRSIDRLNLIPVKDATDVVLSVIKERGFTVVEAKALDELLAAADDFGLNKSFPTDSRKLVRVKAAVAALRRTPTV